MRSACVWRALLRGAFSWCSSNACWTGTNDLWRSLVLANPREAAQLPPHPVWLLPRATPCQQSSLVPPRHEKKYDGRPLSLVPSFALGLLTNEMSLRCPSCSGERTQLWLRCGAQEDVLSVTFRAISASGFALARVTFIDATAYRGARLGRLARLLVGDHQPWQL